MEIITDVRVELTKDDVETAIAEWVFENYKRLAKKLLRIEQNCDGGAVARVIGDGDK